jgi:hypothetical protein
VAGRPRTSGISRKLHRKRWGVWVGFLNSEMEIMTNKPTVFIPPVQLDSYSDFRSIINEAALVVYCPEYFQGPFMDEPKQLRRLTLSAVGVLRNGLPLTFRYVLEDVRDLDRVATEIIEELEYSSNAVRGTIENSRPMGELLAARP